jgi:predicted TIM-barrel fold metal-dependent hydrolase
MIIDAHYHLDERMETVDELLAQMNQHDVGRVALIPTMVDPVHVGKFIAGFATVIRKALMGRLRGLGLFLYRSTVTADGKLSVGGKTYPIYDAPDNESVARVMQAHPDRFYGWVCVNPSVADALAEVEKWAGQPGWIGVKSHPFWHCYPVALLDDVAAYCSDKGWPLLLHLGGDQERGDYRYLPERHPGLKLVYAHAAAPFYRDVWEYAKDRDNVFVDFSNPVYVDEPVRLGAIETLGAARCLHATDGPYGHADQGRMVQEILRLPLSDADKERILGGNFIDMIS